MIAAPAIPVELRGYLHDLIDAIGSVADLEAVYLLGSAALGAYEHGSSDIDVVAVTAGPLPRAERRALAEAAEAIPCPARKLELVVYPRGSDSWEINLNTGEHVSYDTADEPAFWFVIDRAIAEQHAIALLGPPWHELFQPVPRDALLAALADSLDTVGALNATRAWIWLETGKWVSKPVAAAWLRDRVRGEIDDRR